MTTELGDHSPYKAVGSENCPFCQPFAPTYVPAQFFSGRRELDARPVFALQILVQVNWSVVQKKEERQVAAAKRHNPVNFDRTSKSGGWRCILQLLSPGRFLCACRYY